MHSLHGTFQLDMTQAHGIKLPALGTKEVGVAFQGKSTRDREVGSPAHALLMSVGFVIVFPLGILMLRILNKVKIHAIVQGVGLLLVSVGWVIGFVISKRYQRVSTTRHACTNKRNIGGACTSSPE
jgi:protein-S-isoprenylcysteine O-methyltransferase Ste14